MLLSTQLRDTNFAIIVTKYDAEHQTFFSTQPTYAPDTAEQEQFGNSNNKLQPSFSAESKQTKNEDIAHQECNQKMDTIKSHQDHIHNFGWDVMSVQIDTIGQLASSTILSIPATKTER